MAVYSSIYDGPPKGYTRTRTSKKYIVIHNTSNDASAEDEASYAKRRTDGVSSHYYVDSNSIVQSLNTDYKAWHVGSSAGNTYGISYEITGTNSKSTSWWKSNVAWSLLVNQIKRDCSEHGITPRLLSVSEIRAGSKTGIITHNQARLAWGGTTHTDPGPSFPLSYLVELVGGASPSLPTSGVASPTLREGDDGSEVRLLQSNLNEALSLGLAEDGDFGPNTKSGVIALQREAGITEDGIYGPVSADALTDLLEDDMDLDDTVKLRTSGDVKYSSKTTTVEGVLTSTNYYVLQSRNLMLAELAAAKKRDTAILAAVEGLDTEAILERIDQRAAEDAQRDAELATLVEAGLSGRLDAADVLRQMGELLRQAESE